MVGALSCDLFATAPDLPPGTQRLEPLPVFAFWWDLVQSCSGRTASMTDVRWLVSPQVVVDGHEYQGYWWENGNRILLSDSRLKDGSVVRHEMLHAILRRGDHPPEFFADRCAGEVACNDCLPDGYGATAGDRAGAQSVTASELDVTVDVRQPGNTYGVHSGVLAFTVRARNPLNRPVWVSIPADRTFEHRIVGAGITSGVYWTLEPRFYFGAGESRTMVFDVELCLAGSYTARGSFAGQASTEVPVLVAADGEDDALCGTWRDDGPPGLRPLGPSAGLGARSR